MISHTETQRSQRFLLIKRTLYALWLCVRYYALSVEGVISRYPSLDTLPDSLLL